MLGIGIVQRGVFHQAAVTLMVALHSHNDQLFFGGHHIFIHTPGFAVGSIGIKEKVMSVEHIENRIATFVVPTIRFRQIN